MKRDPSASPLDRRVVDQLLMLSADQPGFMDELLATYERTATGHIADLRSAVRRGDHESVASSAHALKGSSRNVGAAGPGALADVLERDARAGRTPEETSIDELADAVHAACATLRAAIEAAR